MKRKYDARQYARRIEYIKNKIQNAAIFCDIIAGYPSETPLDFDASLKFLDEIKFAGLHVFSFSPRNGTPAAALKQLPPAEIKKRADILRAKDKRLRAAFARSLIGTTQQFLAEEETDLAVAGVSSNFQRIIIKGAGKTNKFESVKIISADKGICLGVKI
jgi:threonylcarbamoyladenosine tRNA methylthiotransferase MtaB